MNLLQIYAESATEKNFENRIIYSEDMAKSLVSCFFDSRYRCQRQAGRECLRSGTHTHTHRRTDNPKI